MLARWFEKQWQQFGWAQCLLWPLSQLFALLTALRRYCYRWQLLPSTRLPVPVIVVGNLSVGGVGKTPVVLSLAQALRAAGYQPGLLSRGYGGQFTGEVHPESDPLLMGDEPVLLAQRSQCPVWVHPDRAVGGRALLQAYPACDVLICDDGLQHYALQRTVEIAVIQRPDGLGNGRLLPAGPLRESLDRLKHVDIIVESGRSGSQPLQPCYQLQLQPAAWRSVADDTQETSSEALRSRPLLALAGIGHPQRFFKTVQSLGLTCETRAFPDHHAYTAADFQALAGKTVLMTEKDAVKCRSLGLADAWYLPVQAVLTPLNVSATLCETVLTLLAQRKGVNDER